MKKVLVLFLILSMLISMTACSKEEVGEQDASGTETATVATEEKEAGETATEKELLQIEFFDRPANYQGIQGGWFGKILKDKFNLEVNIIAPNIAGGGETLYQTRTASGFLGDLIVVQKGQLADCIKAGLILDITDYYENSTYLKAYDNSVEGMKNYLGTESVYGIPTRSSLQDPLTPKTFGTSPGIGDFLRFDYYQEVGAPKLNTDDDLLNTLKAMQDAHPTTEAGSKVYGISMFKDWDSIYMKYPITMVSNYGFNAGQEGTNFMLMNWDASETQPVTQDDGAYHNVLKFLFKANQMGILDPDSSSNTWDIITEKTRNGEVLWSMWPWASISQFNTSDNSDAGKGFMAVPVASHTYLADGANPYGSDGNVFAIGSECKNPERVFELLDWLASPEFMELRNTGIKGVMWDVIDGQSQFTEVGKAIRLDPENGMAPDEIGGGNYVDGSCQFNTAVGEDTDTNPTTGESFNADSWDYIITKDRRTLDENWTSVFNSKYPMEYIKTNGLLEVAPGSSFAPPTDSSDIQVKRSMCGEAVVNASWTMIFAKDQAEFDAIWETLKTDLVGLGYNEVLEVDKQNVEGYKAARKVTLDNAK